MQNTWYVCVWAELSEPRDRCARFLHTNALRYDYEVSLVGRHLVPELHEPLAGGVGCAHGIITRIVSEAAAGAHEGILHVPERSSLRTSAHRDEHSRSGIGSYSPVPLAGPKGTLSASPGHEQISPVNPQISSPVGPILRTTGNARIRATANNRTPRARATNLLTTGPRAQTSSGQAARAQEARPREVTLTMSDARASRAHCGEQRSTSSSSGARGGVSAAAARGAIQVDGRASHEPFAPVAFGAFAVLFSCLLLLYALSLALVNCSVRCAARVAAGFSNVRKSTAALTCHVWNSRAAGGAERKTRHVNARTNSNFKSRAIGRLSSSTCTGNGNLSGAKRVYYWRSSKTALPVRFYLQPNAHYRTRTVCYRGAHLTRKW